MANCKATAREGKKNSYPGFFFCCCNKIVFLDPPGPTKKQENAYGIPFDTRISDEVECSHCGRTHKIREAVPGSYDIEHIY